MEMRIHWNILTTMIEAIRKRFTQSLDVLSLYQEERRIVYVGRIAGDFTRRDLRRQFERFGEIEDVSVHFREHGG